MEQIIVRVRDKTKAQSLRELLTALDFVDSVEEIHVEGVVHPDASDDSGSFFALAGLWQDRDLSLASLREQAWTRQRS